METSELRKRTAQSVGWAVVRIGAANVISFAVFSVLARTLPPADFGVFALASLVVELTRIVATAGLGDAIMRSATLDEALADTAFWCNVALGSLVGLATWCAAPLYAGWIGQPEVAPVLRWLAVLAPVAALGGIHTARKLHAFGHKAMAMRVVASNLLGGVAGVLAALRGYGVWSLVIQTAVADASGVVFAWQSFAWRPQLRFHPQRLRAIAGFSASMMLTQILWLLLVRVQDVVIGRFLSAAAVGSYRTAWRMIDLVAQTTIQPVAGVGVITLARLQDDPALFRAAFLRMLGLGALVTLPALFGFGVLATDIITVLFGATWSASGPIAQILTLMAIPFTINYFLGAALAAIGRSGTIARVAMVQAAATVALSLLAAPYGLHWIAAAYVFRAYATMPYQMALFQRDSGIASLDLLRTIAPPLAASIVMVVALLAAGPPLHRLLGHGAASLALAAPFGGAVFAGALLVFARRYVLSQIAALRPLWQRAAPALAAS